MRAHLPARRTSMVTLAMVLACASAAAQRGPQPQPQWRTAWMAAHNVGEVIPDLANTTMRMIVRPALSGRSLRIKLDNSRAQTPATFSAVFVGRSGPGASIVDGTNTAVTFNGGRGVTIPPRGAAWSDPVAFDVRAYQRLTVSLDIAAASDVSMHALGLVTNYRAPGGTAAAIAATAFAPLPNNVPNSRAVEYPIYWLAAVDVLSPSAAGTIVAIGDSWIDGRCSTNEANVVRPDLHLRWIDVAASRLAQRFPDQPRAIVNAGIAGNKIIPPGRNGPATVERLERDVLERAGATHVVLLQGMNDLGSGVTAPQLTAGMREIIDRVHAAGMAIIGATLFPIGRPDRAGWTGAMEHERLAVNDWIRTQAPFDGVVDFDRLMSGGPSLDGRASLRPEHVCDDQVHPNADGYKAMGDFVDLDLFTRARAAAGAR